MMTPSQKNFHLEEYKELRSETVGLLVKIDNLLRYGVLSIAAYFVWTFSNAKTLVDNEYSPLLVALIPVIMGVLISCVAAVFWGRTNDFGRYLEHLESALGHPDLGWEKHKASKFSRKVQGPTHISIVASVAWSIYLFSTLLGAYFLHGHMKHMTSTTTNTNDTLAYVFLGIFALFIVVYLAWIGIWMLYARFGRSADCGHQ